MAASNSGSTFDAGSVERVLDEFRGDNHNVELLFRAHVNDEQPKDFDREAIEAALATLNYRVCLALQHANQHVEYLYARDADDAQIEWYSATVTAGRTVGPIALYPHNVTDRLNAGYPVTAERVDETPFADEELGPHGLDAERDGVILDV